MSREYRYHVIKKKDADRFLTKAERKILYTLMSKVEEARQAEGRDMLDCLVVEHDWPEFNPTWKAIQERVKCTTTT